MGGETQILSNGCAMREVQNGVDATNAPSGRSYDAKAHGRGVPGEAALGSSAPDTAGKRSPVLHCPALCRYSLNTDNISSSRLAARRDGPRPPADRQGVASRAPPARPQASLRPPDSRPRAFCSWQAWTCTLSPRLFEGSQPSGVPSSRPPWNRKLGRSSGVKRVLVPERPWASRSERDRARLRSLPWTSRSPHRPPPGNRDFIGRAPRPSGGLS